MATKYIYLSGTTKWAKVRKPDEKYDNFQVPLYLNEPSKKVFEESGLSLGVKSDDDGEYITLRRPNNKLIKKELVEFGPPKVLDKDNKEFDGLIGNGSEITAKVAVYDTIKGKGHRLESVRVEKLVEYIPSGAGTGVAEAGNSSGRPALPF
jgi:hypothetical protein